MTQDPVRDRAPGRARRARTGPVTPLVLLAVALVVVSQLEVARPYAAVLWLVALVVLLVALVLATVDWRRHRRHRG